MDNGFKPSPQPNEIEANNYSGTTGQTLSTKDEKTIADAPADLKSNLVYNGIDTILIRGSIQSKNFRSGVQGWRLNVDGTVEFN